MMLMNEIPFRHIQQFREKFALCTNGLGVCPTEPKSYQPNQGEASAGPAAPIGVWIKRDICSTKWINWDDSRILYSLYDI
jgi:hypothetical protein